jgi:hypothetical protein
MAVLGLAARSNEEHDELAGDRERGLMTVILL